MWKKSIVPDEVTRITHICCGYPSVIDNENYARASPETYLRLASSLNKPEFNAVSIEDAHRHNDLSLLEAFPDTTIILGTVAIARTRIETVEEIRQRLQKALDHIDAERLLAAPDCGLGMLSRKTAGNMVQVAKSVD